MLKAFGPGWTAQSLTPLSGGHAGAVFLLEAKDPSAQAKRFVLKCAPPGVATRGAADVCRPEPLLRALRGAGFPAARVAWSDPQGAHLGVPHIAFEWLDGQHNFPLSKAEGELQRLPDSLWLQATRLLARLHTIEWRDDLMDWSNPASLANEIARWRPTYLKAPDPAWIVYAEAAEAALISTVPEPGGASILHGDYQTSNLMVKDEAIEAVIDWDLATIGDPLLDLGWLVMWADEDNWTASWRSRCGLSIGAISEAYFVARGLSPRPVHWHHAFACYKFASIACLNVKLHRSGRRPDSTWERFSLDVAWLFQRARALAAVAR